jgi:hypothetical protein
MNPPEDLLNEGRLMRRLLQGQKVFLNALEQLLGFREKDL